MTGARARTIHQLDASSVAGTEKKHTDQMRMAERTLGRNNSIRSGRSSGVPEDHRWTISFRPTSLISRSSREPCQPGEDGSHDWEPDRQVSPQADDGQIEAGLEAT